MSTSPPPVPPSSPMSNQDVPGTFQQHQAPPASTTSTNKPPRPTYVTSISQIVPNDASFVNALYEGEEDEIDGCLTPDPGEDDDPNRSGRFRRGWAASSNTTPTTGRNGALENSLQASSRSQESMLEKYRSQYEAASSSRSRLASKHTTDEYREEHPNRPSNSRWKQQNLPAWQPMFRPVNVIGSFLGTGVLLLVLGVFMLRSNLNTQDIVTDYTHCQSIEYPNRTCAQVLEKELYLPGLRKCTCHVSINLPSALSTPVYLYYSLDGFYQNHRRYVSSIDHEQLKGEVVAPEVIEKNCGSHYGLFNADKGIVYAPCGAIANSLFSDTFKLKFASSPMKIKETDIIFPLDRLKFQNPSDPSWWTKTAKPLNWTRKATDLDPANPANNALQNEHFIVWMRTAAFPSFRKLWGRLEPESIFAKADSLPAGEYLLEVLYTFPTVRGKLSIPKRVHLSNTSWMGGRNLFLPILYLTMGGLCILTGVGFLILIWKVKRTQEKIGPLNGKALPPVAGSTSNYQTMSRTDGVQFTTMAPSPIPEEEEEESRGSSRGRSVSP